MIDRLEHVRIPARLFDAALAAVLLVAFEIEILTSPHVRGPVLLNALLAAAITIPTIWRRRAPLAYACVVMGLGIVMSATLTDVTSLVVPLTLLFIPAYTVAAYEDRTRALIGLVVCVVAPWVLDADAIRTLSADQYGFTAGMSIASWMAGRALRARRLLNEELERKAQRIAAEHDTRERLAVADERTRIARELHAVVAGSVSAMVVQTEAAQQMLDGDPAGADEAMAAIEATGRETLAEMRRILGVLRRADDGAALAPQPGVGQIHSLVQRARDDHRQVGLEVDGDPGPLPASVDLGIYRILEEALKTAQSGDVEVLVRFAQRDIELQVVSAGAVAGGWPTLAMRERVALCHGEVEADDGRLTVRLPRAFEEVPA
jgi:signal transduction histidine kinase